MTIKNKPIPHVITVGIENSVALGIATMNSPCPGIRAGMISEAIIIKVFLSHFFDGLVFPRTQKIAYPIKQ